MANRGLFRPPGEAFELLEIAPGYIPDEAPVVAGASLGIDADRIDR